MPGEDKLRQLAAWYREFAERAGSPWIWEARLRRAKDLKRKPTVSKPNSLSLRTKRERSRTTTR